MMILDENYNGDGPLPKYNNSAKNNKHYNKADDKTAEIADKLLVNNNDNDVNDESVIPYDPMAGLKEFSENYMKGNRFSAHNQIKQPIDIIKDDDEEIDMDKYQSKMIQDRYNQIHNQRKDQLKMNKISNEQNNDNDVNDVNDESVIPYDPMAGLKEFSENYMKGNRFSVHNQIKQPIDIIKDDDEEIDMDKYQSKMIQDRYNQIHNQRKDQLKMNKISNEQNNNNDVEESDNNKNRFSITAKEYFRTAKAFQNNMYTLLPSNIKGDNENDIDSDEDDDDDDFGFQDDYNQLPCFEFENKYFKLTDNSTFQAGMGEIQKNFENYTNNRNLILFPPPTDNSIDTYQFKLDCLADKTQTMLKLKEYIDKDSLQVKQNDLLIKQLKVKLKSDGKRKIVHQIKLLRTMQLEVESYDKSIPVNFDQMKLLADKLKQIGSEAELKQIELNYNTTKQKIRDLESANSKFTSQISHNDNNLRKHIGEIRSYTLEHVLLQTVKDNKVAIVEEQKQ